MHHTKELDIFELLPSCPTSAQSEDTNILALAVSPKSVGDVFLHINRLLMGLKSPQGDIKVDAAKAARHILFGLSCCIELFCAPIKRHGVDGVLVAVDDVDALPLGNVPHDDEVVVAGREEDVLGRRVPLEVHDTPPAIDKFAPFRHFNFGSGALRAFWQATVAFYDYLARPRVNRRRYCCGKGGQIDGLWRTREQGRT